MTKLIIKNGHLIDPVNNIDARKDIEITNSQISAITECSNPTKNDTIIDASEMYVFPGLIDTHVHLREPGEEYKETIETGIVAALKGGITSLCSMPNTHPVCDNEGIVRYILEKSHAIGLGKVYPIGAITKNLEGKELSEIGNMKKAGIIALSDDGNPVTSSYLLRRAMEYAHTFNLHIIDHCEDVTLSAHGVMHEGYFSTILGLKGIPSSSEEIQVARDILLSQHTQIPIHIAHLSTRTSVNLIRWAKENNIPVTAEVTVHHLLLTDKDLIRYDTNLKVKPPLRSEDDRIALIEGLSDGTIDTIVTDHAPHADIDKDLEFDYASFGMIGLETCFPLLFSSQEIRDKLSLSKLIQKMTSNPAQIFNIPGGNASLGTPADLVIFNPTKKVTIDDSFFFSKSRNTPFMGKVLTGVPCSVIVNGKLVFKDNTIIA
ncbi:dihydroorotase [Chlamydiota bacterium]